MLIMIAAVTFMLLSCGGALWIVNLKKITFVNIKGGYKTESSPGTSLKTTDSKTAKPDFFSRIKGLVSNTVKSAGKGRNSCPPEAAGPAIVATEYTTAANPGKEWVRPVEWDIKFVCKLSVENPDQRYVECNGWISFEPGVFPKVKLYSSPEKDGNYSLCGEAVLAKSTAMLDSIKVMEKYIVKIKNPEQKKRMLERLNRRKEFYERYKRNQKQSSGKSHPFEYKILSFKIKDEKSLDYKKNNVWYKLEVLSSRGDLLKTYTPVKIPLFYHYYKREEKKHAYSAAFPGQDKIDVTLAYFTMKKQYCYHILQKLDSTYEYNMNQKMKYGTIGNVVVLYTQGYPGWVNKAGREYSTCSWPSEDTILELGSDEKGSFLQLLYSKYEYIKLTRNGNVIYPYKLQKSSMSRTENGVHGKKNSKLDFQRLYLTTGNHSGELLQVALRDTASKQIKVVDMQMFPEPPPLEIENSPYGVVVKWGDLNSLLDSGKWLIKPRLMLIRETRIKQREKVMAVHECTPAAGSYTDVLPIEFRENAFYYIQLQDGVLKNWMYDKDLKKVDYYTCIRSFRVKKNVRQVPKVNNTVTRKLRIAVNTSNLYHDNTGPISAKLESVLYKKILSSGTMVMFDRLHSEAIDQEKTMTQSLNKVKKNFSLKKIPADYAFQIRDRSTSIGDFIELWLIRVKGRLDGVIRDSDNKEYEPYNNVWRIGRIMLNDPDADAKMNNIVGKALDTVAKLSPQVLPEKDNGKKVTKFVWDGLKGVNQGQPVYGEKLEGLSESLMLASADALKSGNILSRDDWLLIRQERDFSKMSGENLKSGSEGQILISGKVVNSSNGLNYYMMATNVFTSEVVGSFKCNGPPLEAGRKIAGWCEALRLSPRRKSLYEDNIEANLAYKERVAVYLICKRYANVHRVKSKKEPERYFRQKHDSPFVYADKQWKIGNRKYAIQLLEENISTIGSEGAKQLARFYHQVGLFEKEKAFLEGYTDEWAVRKLAYMSEFKPVKPEYKYIDSLPDQRFEMDKKTQKSWHLSSERMTNNNYEYEYSTIRPEVAESWNKEEKYMTYSSVYSFKNRNLAELLNSASVLKFGVIMSASTMTDEILKKKTSGVKILRWSAIDLFDRKTKFNGPQRGVCRAYLNCNYRQCILNTFNFHRPSFLVLNQLDKNMDQKVKPFTINRDGSGTYVTYTSYKKNRPIEPAPVSMKQLMDQAVDMIVSGANNGRRRQSPDIHDIWLCEMMAKHGNLKAKLFVDRIRTTHIPSVNEVLQPGENASKIRYEVKDRLEKKGISSDMVIYRASMRDANALILLKKYPEDFFPSYDMDNIDRWYFIAKRFPANSVISLLSGNNEVYSKMTDSGLGTLRYAERNRLEDIIVSQYNDIFGKSSRLSSFRNTYYYLAVGLESNKVKNLLIEKYRKREMPEDGLTALVHLTGRPLQELDNGD